MVVYTATIALMVVLHGPCLPVVFTSVGAQAPSSHSTGVAREPKK